MTEIEGKSGFFKIALIFVIVAGIGLLFYTNYRAATLSITHDEGVIYQIISSHSIGEIVNYVIPQDHMLNSLLMKVSTALFPDHEYTLRLPNLLGHFLYIVFSILLLIRLKNPHLLVAGFVLLNFNPYLLDFFSAARGYGLSVSFMMVSIYFAFSFTRTSKLSTLILSCFFAILSVLTIYTMLNFFIALGGYVVLMIMVWWLNGKLRMDRKCIQASGVYLLVFVVSAVLLYIQLIGPLQRVQSEQYIYQEFQSDFYHGTVRPIIFRSIYNSDPTLTVDLVSYGLFAVYSIAFVMMVIMAIRRNFTFTGRLLFFSFIISVIIVLSLTLQNQLFNIRFVQNRMATFIAPLFVLALIGLFDEFLRHKALRVPALILIYCISALFLINTIKHVNFKWYLDWQEDASTREMMDDLCKDVASKPAGQVKMGIVWLHEPAINFYRKTWNLDWLKEVDRKGYNGDFDYFYVGNADSILNKEIFRDKKILKIYEKANTVLLKKMNTDEEIPQ